MTVISSAVLLLQAKNYSGSGNWLDESGNSHDATAVGSPSFDGTKFTLNGTSDGFTVPNHADLNITAVEDLTVICWAMCPDATPAGFGQFVCKNAATIGWSLQKSTLASIFFEVRTPTFSASKATVSDGVPFFAVGRRNAGSALIEATLGTAAFTTTSETSTGDRSNTTALSIGFRTITSSQWLAGDIYAIAVWKTALSDADVATAITELQATPATFTPRVMMF